MDYGLNSSPIRETYIVKILSFITSLLLVMVTSAFAADYNYISPEDMRQRITDDKATIIVDIQVEEEFRQHHLPDSLATFAYPVKTDAERTKIDKAVEEYQKSKDMIVIVCPRGKGGAKRCYDYMKANGVPQEKLYILEKGMAGWPYSEMVMAGEDKQ
jgi:rhodanese-related sulfurtransferase